MEDYKDSLDRGSSPEKDVNYKQLLENGHDLRKHELKAEDDDRYEMKPLLRGFKSWPSLEDSRPANRLMTVSRTFDNSPKQHSTTTNIEQYFKEMPTIDVMMTMKGSSSHAMENVGPSSEANDTTDPPAAETVNSRCNDHSLNEDMCCHQQTVHHSSDLVDRVRTILCGGSADVDAEWSASAILGRCNLFTQLDILCHSQNGNSGWKQMARYLKYEEKVELGGRWSKPHVATASLHSLLHIRQSIADSSCVVDLDATPKSRSLHGLSETIIEAISRRRNTDKFVLNNLCKVLCRPHKHKNRHGKKKKKSEMDNPTRDSEGSFKPRAGSMQRRKSLVRRDGKDYWAIYTTYHQGIDPDHLLPYSPNKKLMRKIPTGAEAAIVMIGQVDCIDCHQLLFFCRLRSAEVIDELIEVSVPTRFVVLAFGHPKTSSISELFEIGRAFAALLNDKVFCEVAYKASCAQDLLYGLDEFLDDLTVLPPSVWDPTTRLDPPQKTRPTEKIWKRLSEATRYLSAAPETSSAHDDSSDESLKRTGRVFGGLISDVRNRYRFFASDFTDGLHLQCFASIIFLYFACITPIVTFGGLMGQKTDNYMGTMETLMSGAICGVVYALFSGQPLNIIGSTGPLLVFESILYHLCKERAIEFLSFRFWIGIWVFVYLLLIVAFDLSAFVRYITRFTEESFAVLISVIFIYEACTKTLEIWTTHPVMRGQAERTRSRNSCHCSSPPPPPPPPHPPSPPPSLHLHQNLEISRLANDSPFMRTISLVANGSGLGPSGYPDETEDQRLLGSVNGSSSSISSSVADIGDWSSVLSEDCITFRQRVVVGRGCISASECTDRGWILWGGGHEECGGGGGGGGEEEGLLLVQSVPDVFLLSCILFFGTFSAAMFFRTLRNTPYFPTQVRTLVSDFAVFLAVITWSWVDYWFSLDTPKLQVPNKFKPTLPNRGWFVNPMLTSSSWWLIPAGALPGALATILVFLDQQITAVIVNRKEHKLKKGHGYHLDLLVLSFLIAICSALGLPWFVAATVRAITHVRSLIRESEVKAPGERPQMLGVREQRLTGICIHLLIGLSSLLTSVLKHIPMPVLYGVFLYMGVTSLAGVQFIERILIMFMPVKYQPDHIYLRHVQTSRVHYFTIIQVACSALMWVIKSVKVTSIAFPLVLVGLVVARKGMDFIFTQRDLYWLDNLLPDDTRRRFEDFNRRLTAASPASPARTTSFGIGNPPHLPPAPITEPSQRLELNDEQIDEQQRKIRETSSTP